MNDSQVQALASRFIRLAPEKRSVFLEALAREGVDFATFPIASGAGEAERSQLSYSQQRMWFLWQLDPDSAAYNLPTATELNGPLDREALTRALNSVVARHEVLRTRFPIDEQGQPRQLICDSAAIEIDIEDLASQSSAQQNKEVRNRVEQESLIPFDLVSGPLLRVKLFTLAEHHHVLMITLHHIVADGWSINILIDEAMRFYEAFTTGSDADVMPLPIQYADYALWQRSWLESGELHRQLDYWRQQLAGDQPVLQLPTDHARPQKRSFAGARYELEIDNHLADGLRVVAKQHNASLFTVLLAAFQVLLYRYTGESDIRVGVPVANRHRPETEELIGCFINTQVMRATIDYQSTFSELLDTVRDTVIDAQSNQELPFEQLVDALRPECSLTHNPMFQVMFNHQALVADVTGLDSSSGLQVRPFAWDKQTTQFDLKLDTWEKGGQLYAAFTYARDVFERATVENISDCWRLLLTTIVQSPSTAIGDLSLLDDASSRRILWEWTQESSVSAIAEPVHTLFEAKAALTPDVTAVVSEADILQGNPVEVRLTYKELNAQANQLARYLRTLGVGPDSPVAVALDRSTTLVVAILAVLKAGGAYVPLDPEYPERRLHHMMADGGADIVLTEKNLRARFPMAKSIKVVTLDSSTEASAWNQVDEANLEISCSPGNLAYIIYTSGTTGKPKGVAVSHGSLWHYLRAMDDELALPGTGNFAMVSTCAADLGHTVFYGALCGGRTLHLLKKVATLDAERFARYMERHSIAVVKMVPSHLQGLLQAHGSQASIPSRCLILGGEACSPALVQRVNELRPDCRIINHYGPTETTVGVLTHRVESLPRRTEHIPLGKPLAGSCAYIVDDALNPVPTNAIGELYIGGAGLARGYCGQAVATAERFVPNPFAEVGGERLYRSGDRVRLNQDDDVVFRGRIDNQVKIRGFRIEIDEIEALLKQSPSLVDAAVAIIHGEQKDPLLVAYVVPKDQALVDAKDEPNNHFCVGLKTELLQALPDYMVPSHYVTLARMPVTDTGKLNRKALPAIDTHDIQRQYRPPETPLQQLIATVWQEVLGIERVGLDDNFFALGGHSLLITQVVTRLRRVFKVELPLRTLFEASDFKVFCETVAEWLDHINPDTQEQVIEPVPRDQPLPLSFAQTRQWLLWQMEPASAAYNINLAFRIRGDLDIHALQQSFDYLMARHEIWRTHFEENGDSVYQVITAAQPFDLTLEHLPVGTDPEDRLRALGREPFDLSRGPLLRVKLIQLGEQDYLLAVTQHHVISDGWSMQVLVNELADVYAAFRAGREPAIAPLPIQYADYAQWQRRFFDEAEKDRQLNYWWQRLGDDHPVLELPADFPRPSQPSFAGADHTFTLPHELVQKIEHQARAQGVTPFMWFLASFQILLYRYSGQEQIRVGAPVANRTRLETERLVGFFVNTQVHRADITGDMTVTELLQETKQRALEAQDHQDLPFEQLVAALQLERSASYSPLFQVLFNYQVGQDGSHESYASRLGDISVEEVTWDEGTAQFDLMLEVAERVAGTVARFNFSTDLFKREAIERFAGHWQHLLISMADEPSRRVSELSMFSDGETASILEEWNTDITDYGEGACIHSLFEAQAEANPEAIALILPGTEAGKAGGAKDQTLTYAELNTRANQLAHTLRAMGVGPDVLVGVAVERSLEMIIGLLGILKAGGAYVPLDPAYPEHRLRYMIDDSGIALLLTQSRHRNTLPVREGTHVLCLDEDGAGEVPWYEAPCENPPLLTHPNNLAYVIYTSGSTGKPKGTLLAHRNVSRLLQGTEKWFHFDNKDVWTLFHSYAFDFSVWEIFGALLHGGKLLIVPRETARTTDDFYQLLCDHQVTVLNQTPSAFRPLMALARERAESGNKDLALRHIIFGGEALAAETLRPWFECFGDQAPQLINMYGITETTVHVTYRPMTAEDREGSPIGERIDDLSWYVLDRGGRPVASGCSGELYVGQAGLARGYLNRPGLTAERFVPDPYSQNSGARLYRTGDLARYKTGGVIQYLGRIDHQIKIRGFRIELGEIEAQISAQDSVKNSAVIAQDVDNSGGQRLMAYVVPGDLTLLGKDADTDAQSAFRTWLKEQLQTALPEYMVPSQYVLLDKLPLTPNGKLDHKALPTVDSGIFAKEYEAPQTALQRQVAEIWQAVLGIDQVGLNDNFFELGGHSLLATQAVSRIRQSLVIELPLRTLFEASDLRDLAERVSQAKVVQDSPIERISRDQPLPLSYAQQRQWILWQLEPDNSAYHTSAALRLKGVIDKEALNKSFDTLISRHEVLRTHFVDRDGNLYQIIEPTLSVPIAHQYFEKQPGETIDEGLRRILQAHVRQPFNLTQGPLLRILLIELNSNDQVLLLVQHHIISDAWSMRLMVEELVAAYQAYRQNQQPELSELPIQYADYAAWQRHIMEAGEAERQLAYWRRQLGEEHPILELPTDHPRPQQPSYRGASCTQVLPKGLSERVIAEAKRAGVTPFMLLLASFQLLLHRYSGQDDIRVGVPIANRTRLETERLIGFFVNTQVLRTQISPELTVNELLQQVKRTALDAQAHQDLPFERLVEALQPERNLSTSPLFQVMFNFHEERSGESEHALKQLGDLIVEGIAWEQQTAQFDLTLIIVSTTDGLFATLNYATDLFERETIVRLADHWQRLLEAMVSERTRRLSELAILSDQESSSILREWNATQVSYGEAPSIQHLFEAQVEKIPDATALIFPTQDNRPEQVLTYTELNTQANQLAHTLGNMGVGPDVLVGIAVERSIQMIVGVLAILKAGGAYVPLDPAYPKDRLVHMVENSGLSLILTQASIDQNLPLPSYIQRIYMDGDGTGCSVDNPSIQLHAKNLAYMIFTSGTTGLPKGVGIDQGSLARHTEIYANRLALNESDSVLQYATLNFDTFGEQVFPSLSRGATVIMRGEELWSHDTFYSNLLRYDISVVNLTPSIWFHLIKDFAEQGRQDFGRLRRMIVGGEAMLPEALILWQQLGLAERAELWNFYGPTEATAAATSFCCNTLFEEDKTLPTIIPIGSPLGGRLVYIVGNDLNLLPSGVAGEMMIGGGLLARGYHSRPSLTAERFVPNPYGEEEGGRLYRTGDLTRHQSDGTIDYLGRLDHQVKIRGMRIELGEIESQLNAQDSVKEAVVVAQSVGGAGGQQLVAYLVPTNRTLVDCQTDTGSEVQGVFRSELKAHLQLALPDYMVPNQYVLLEQLPLTPNGKLDRKALPTLDGSAFTREYVVPQTELERQLASIWQEVLGVEQVGLNDNFFELGGHSLLATQVVSRIRQTQEIELSLRTLFEAPDLHSLAQKITGESPVQVIPMARVSRDRSLPLSYAQRRQWVLWQLAPDSAAYHITSALRLTGSLDIEALRQSFAVVIGRHEVLRTHFAEQDGELYQMIVPELSLPLSLETLDIADAETEGQALKCLLQAHAGRPFDLTRGPLLRAQLIQLGSNDHVLSLVQHHIISDAWSMRVMVEELVSAYRAYSQDQQPALPELPIQYADYAAWQRQIMEAGEAERQLSYWRGQLGEEHPVLELPTDRPRPHQPSHRGANCVQVLPKELSAHITSTAQQAGVTPFMLLLASFQLLLHRYSGQDDIRVGVPIANRTRLETERLIGFFVNTQVLRAHISPEATVNDLLQQVKRTALEAQAHQDLPFEQLVEALQPERSLHTTPLFQVMFNFQDAGKTESNQPLSQLDELVVEGVSGERQTAQFDLTLNITTNPEGYVAFFNYATDLFEPKTIERLALHWQSLLDAMVTEPNNRLSELVMLGEEETTRILKDWNATDVDYGEGTCIHALFEAQVEKTPEAIALIFPAQENQPEQTLTYADLNTQANQLAHTLRNMGVGPDVLVGIAVERSVEMVIGLLGILKAGGAYVPLDPEYPEDRLSYMMQDSGIRLLLIQSDLQGSLPIPDDVQALCLDQPEIWDHNKTGNFPVITSPQNLAYVIYTSGSTGKPKGTLLAHRNVSRLMKATEQWFHFNDQDVWTLFHSYAFDFSVWEIFGALLHGGKLLIVPRDVAHATYDFYQLLCDHQVTVLNQTPSAFRPLMALACEHAETGNKDLALRHVIFGGEALAVETLQPWFAHFGDQIPQLTNMYGITETTVHVTYRPLTSVDQEGSPIGERIPDLSWYVLDGDGYPMAPGCIGELHIGRAGLARGYLGRPALTAERFIPDPYGQEGGGRLYRTGDLARYRSDGNIEYAGRLDHQVKIRGFRIELGEIEAQLSAQDSVKESVVLAQDVGSTGGQQLVAYVVPADSALVGDEVDAEVQGSFRTEVKSHLQASLPNYMVPNQYVLLDKLPLTSNGKLDRKTLPQLDGSAFAREYEAPQTELEQQLASIWQKVLGVEQVGLNDNFFELGGHSLLSIQLLGRIRDLGWEASVRDLFLHPQLSDFVQSLKQPGDSAEWAVPPNGIPEDCQSLTPDMLMLIDLQPTELSTIEAAVPGGANNIQDIYPLAPLQEGILFHHLLGDEGDIYIILQTIRLASREKLEQFISSFNRVITRHDILRTAILWEGLSDPVQVVVRQAPLTLQWLEVDQRASVADQLRAHVDKVHYRLDVRRAPMMEAFVAYDCKQDCYLLQLANHHLVSDHTTLELIIQEIGLFQEGREDELPDPLPFRHFVAQARLGVTQEEHETFFTQMLGDVDEPSAPFGLMDVTGNGTAIEENRQPLSDELAHSVRQQAQRYGVSAAALFHLAWGLVVANTSGREDAVFGTVLFGRMQGVQGAERALGLFINTLPLRIKLQDHSVEQALKQAHESLAELMHHEHASLALAQRCSALERGVPLFSTLLNYRYSAGADSNIQAAWDGVEPLAGEERTNYPITLSVDDLGEGFSLHIHADQAVDAHRLCGYVVESLTQLAETLEKDPSQRASEVPMLSEAERIRILKDWNATEVDYGEGACIHTLFEEQVRRSPDATALIFPAKDGQPERFLTYAELNVQANQVAHTLRDMGVGPDVLVGIAMERSVEMVIGLLGILKAGGAYVPLDPEYPKDRLSYMLEDSGIQLLLTQSSIRETLAIPADLQALCLEQLDTGHQRATGNLPLITCPQHLAYVIYTSGSTGQPKGTLLAHCNVSRLMQATEQWFHFNDQDVWTLFHSYAFDFSVWEVFGALLSGGKLLIVPRETTRVTDDFYQLLCDHRVTILNQTPSAFRPLMALVCGRVKTDNKELALRHVIFGGEALAVDTLQPWFARFGDQTPQLTNMYGITETTVHVTYRRLTIADQEGSPIGERIPDLSWYVLDGDGHPIAPGCSGELHVGKAGLARGYLGRPALTAERFIPNPHDPNGGGRLYRTGDLARYQVDGTIDHLGRMDHQVKIRGFRIELGEIESQLQSLAAIKEAVVLAQKVGGSDSQQLVAYVIPVDGALVNEDTEVDMDAQNSFRDEVRSRLRSMLPEYMVPNQYVLLGRLPLTPNGKLERKALPRVDSSDFQRKYQAPRTAFEQQLADIWQEVLGVDRVGLNDNFFELGGDSIMAVRLLSKIKIQTGRHFKLRKIFEYPIFSDLANDFTRSNAVLTDKNISDIENMMDEVLEAK